MNAISLFGGLENIKNRAKCNTMDSWIDDFMFMMKEVDMSQYPTPMDMDDINADKFCCITDEDAIQNMLTEITKASKMKNTIKGEGKILERVWYILKQTLLKLDETVIAIIDCTVTSLHEQLKKIKDQSNEEEDDDDAIHLREVKPSSLPRNYQALHKQLQDTMQSIMVNILLQYKEKIKAKEDKHILNLEQWINKYAEIFDYEKLKESFQAIQSMAISHKELSLEDEQDQNHFRPSSKSFLVSQFPAAR